MVALISYSFTLAAHSLVHGVDALRRVHGALRDRGLDPALQREAPWSLEDEQDALRDVHRHVDPLRRGRCSLDHLLVALTLTVNNV